LISGAIKTQVKQAAQHVMVRRYDIFHQRQAMAAVAAIQRHNAVVLTRHLKAQADDYAVQVLGGKRFAPWLYVYSLIAGEFKEGWIPDNYFGRIVCPTINNGLDQLTHYKTFTNVVFNTDALPDVGYYLNGQCYDRERRPISLAALQVLAREHGTHVFAKQDGSGRGDGIAKLQVQHLTQAILEKTGNCVLQAPIVQHSAFDAFATTAVATVRITTVKNTTGAMELRAAYLRLGCSNTQWVRSDDSVRVAIVDAQGSLDAAGYTSAWQRVQAHPDTQTRFAGRCVPAFGEAVRFCLGLHARVPHFAIVGWDIAVDAQQTIRLIEWNGAHCDIKFSEAATGPCFAGLGWESLAQQS
jgi:hypothetical protein